MSEGDFIDWELLFSPGKKKRKKKAKSSSLKMLTQKPKEDPPKKKKKSAKFKKHMAEWKEKRKEKKKKKKMKLSQLPEDSYVNDCEDVTECMIHLPSESTTHKSKKKQKKRVAFDLTHDSDGVKCPKLSSVHLQPADSPSPIRAIEKDTAGVEPSHVQVKTSDSQSTSDDMQSQDLFITQKTFRIPLSEMSNEENSDRAEDNTKVTEFFYRETQEECALFKTQKITKLEKKVKRSPVHTFPKKSMVVTSSPNAENKTEDCNVPQQVCFTGQHQKTLISTSTQTENFFTAELSLCLNFCKRSESVAESDELVPLDLSLSRRARREQNPSSKAEHEDTYLKEIIEVDDAGSAQLSLCEQGKEERTISPQSESDNKSADTTVSSEDTEGSSRISRLELMQVRAVQMRLNESFFFKTKGEGPSPRPESPLMKLVQGRERKSHKKN